MKRLSGWDALLLYSETASIPQHTLKVAVLDASDYNGEFTFDTFRRTFSRRLHLLEPLRYELIGIPLQFHRPMWRENCSVDLDYHLRRIEVASPGDRRELDAVIGQVANTPLDRNRPLWEVYFVEGMSDHRFALIAKVHHALADGVASANLLARGLDLHDASQVEQDDYITDPCPSGLHLLREAAVDHIKQIGALPGLLRHTAVGISRVLRNRRTAEGLASTFDPPPSFLNHLVSADRRFASKTFALADVKKTSKELGVTINDLVLSIAAGALRQLLLRYDGVAERPLLAVVPICVDPSPDRIAGNALSQMIVSLPVHVADPADWVRLVKIGSSAAKANSRELGLNVPGHWLQYLPPAVAQRTSRRLASRDTRNRLGNIPISNVPGPRERARVAGALLSDFFSVGPLTFGMGINITVWSYVDQLTFSVLADGRSVEDAHEVTTAVVDAFVQIRRAAGLSEQLTITTHT